MTAIACLDEKNGIGKDGKLLISIPGDMKFFRETTKDSIVVMGRKTLFSFKNKAPLPNRLNIVFTNNEDLVNDYKSYDNIIFVKNESELNKILNSCAKPVDDIVQASCASPVLNRWKGKQVYVIGGAKIYNDLIDECDTALITRVYKTFDADTFFPNLDTHGFTISKKSDIYTYDDIKYQFVTYVRN